MGQSNQNACGEGQGEKIMRERMGERYKRERRHCPTQPVKLTKSCAEKHTSPKKKKRKNFHCIWNSNLTLSVIEIQSFLHLKVSLSQGFSKTSTTEHVVSVPERLQFCFVSMWPLIVLTSPPKYITIGRNPGIPTEERNPPLKWIAKKKPHVLPKFLPHWICIFIALSFFKTLKANTLRLNT